MRQTSRTPEAGCNLSGPRAVLSTSGIERYLERRDEERKMMSDFSRRVRLGLAAVVFATAAHAAMDVHAGRAAFSLAPAEEPEGLITCGSAVDPCLLDPLVIAARAPGPVAPRVRMYHAEAETGRTPAVTPI
jgi:hypothetical protein